MDAVSALPRAVGLCRPSHIQDRGTLKVVRPPLEPLEHEVGHREADLGLLRDRVRSPVARLGRRAGKRALEAANPLRPREGGRPLAGAGVRVLGQWLDGLADVERRRMACGNLRQARLQRPGVDYTVAGAVITMTGATASGDNVWAVYLK